MSSLSAVVTDPLITVTFSLTGADASNPNVWFALYPNGQTPDGNYLAYCNPNGSTTTFDVNPYVNAGTLQLPLPAAGAGALFDVALIRGPGYGNVLVTSVACPTPTLGITATVLSDGWLDIIVGNPSGARNDWVTIVPAGAAPSATNFADRAYLNDTKTMPAVAWGGARLRSLACPLDAGNFDVHLLATDGTTSKAHTTITSVGGVVTPRVGRDWLHASELVVNTFGPGVSTQSGVTNPAGPRSGRVLDVEAGTIKVSGTTVGTFTQGSLSAALYYAMYGDDLVLASRTNPNRVGGYVGEFQIPVDAYATGGNPYKVVDANTPMLPWKPTEPSYIRLMPSDWASLPSGRVTPSDTMHLALIKGSQGGHGGASDKPSVISFAFNSATDETRQHHYWLEGIQIEPSDAPESYTLGVDQGQEGAPDLKPHHIVLDRVWIHGNPTGQPQASLTRGIYLGFTFFALLHTRVSDINEFGGIGECSAMLIGGGMHGCIQAYNSYFSGSTMCVMHGGTGADQYAQDFVYRRCVFQWPRQWQQDQWSHPTTTVSVSGITWTGSASLLWPPSPTHGIAKPLEEWTDPWVYVPNAAQPPAKVNLYSYNDAARTFQTASLYGDRPAGTSFGLLSAAVVDHAGLSPNVTVTISDKTVTRNSGTWRRRVEVGRYFFLLDSLAPTRHRITQVTPTTLTLATAPGDGIAIVNWSVGTWDGLWLNTAFKNLLEFKFGQRVLVEDCVFDDYWHGWSAQAYPFTFKTTSQNPGNYNTGHLIMRRNLFRRCVAGISTVGDYDIGPMLFQDNLWLLNDPQPGGVGEIANIVNGERFAFSHNTFIMVDDQTHAPVQGIFRQRVGGLGHWYADNVLVHVFDQTIVDANEYMAADDDRSISDLVIQIPDGLGGLKNAMYLNIPQAHYARNVHFGSRAAAYLRANGLLRTLTVPTGEKLYGNAAVDGQAAVGFVNWTGDELESPDYALQAIPVTDPAVTVEAGLTVRKATGTFPATIQPGTPFRLLADPSSRLTSVQSNNGATLTLAAAYPGGTSGTAVFTFQGSATDATDPGARNLSQMMKTWADVTAGLLPVGALFTYTETATLPARLSEAQRVVAADSQASAESVAIDLGERGELNIIAAPDVTLPVADTLPVTLTDGDGTDTKIEGVLGVALQLEDARSLDLVMTGTVGLEVGLGEASNQPAGPSGGGILEPWGVPDDLTSVNGLAPWTRVSGTSLVVQNGQARCLTGDSTLQIARCDIDLGNINQVVALDLAQFTRNDAALTSLAVLARMLNDGTLTFYQARALLWNGGNWFDIWRVVTNTWTRIGGPVLLTPTPGQRLELQVSGTPTPTLLLRLDGSVILGPFDDPGGIVAGQYAGWSAQIDGGSQALVAADNWLGAALGATAYTLLVDEPVPLRLSERTGRDKQLFPSDLLTVGLGESPHDTWANKVAAEAVAAGLIDGGAVPRLTWLLGEGLPSPLVEAESAVVTGLLIAGTELAAVQVVEAPGLRAAWTQGEPVGVALSETAGAPVDLTIAVPTASTVAVAVEEAGAPRMTENRLAESEAVGVGLDETAEAPAQAVPAETDLLALGLAGAAVAENVTVMVPVVLFTDVVIEFADIGDETVLVAEIAVEAVRLAAFSEDEVIIGGGD